MSFKTLRAGWNDFWFKPVPPTPIAFYRILFGAMVLSYFALLSADTLMWFGQKGLITRETAAKLHPWPHINLFHLLPAGDTWVIALFALFLLAALCLTLGLFTRFSAFLLWLALLSVHKRNPLMMTNGSIFMQIACFYLIFSRAGDAFSLDRLIRKKQGGVSVPPPLSAPWAQRLIQIQLATLYFWTFYWKIHGSQWLDGTAVYYVARMEEFWRFRIPFLFDHLLTIKLLTWGTLLFEFSLGVLIWFRPLRIPLIAAGIFFHFMLDLTLNIPYFQWAMITAYALFLEPEHRPLPKTARKGGGTPTPAGAWKILITFFILFHLTAMCLSDLPFPALQEKLVKQNPACRFIARYMHWGGMAHSWQMFAPKAPDWSSRVDAEVIFKDGSWKIWESPRMGNAGFLEKWLGTLPNRWKTFLYAYRPTWPDIARYIARLYAGQPGNPPQSVKIIRSMTRIGPPDRKNLQPVPKSYNYEKRIEMIYYPVSPEDLK